MDNMRINSDDSESTSATPIQTINATFSGQTCRMGPPTWGQIGMWLMHKRLLSRTDTLNLQLTVYSPKNVKPDDIIRSVITLVCDHEALRTTFQDAVDGRLWTTTLADGEFPVNIYSSIDSHEPSEAFVKKVLAVERRHSFDISDLPVRLAMIELPSGAHCISLVLSHMATDGYSVEVLKSELEKMIERGGEFDIDQRPSGEERARLQPFEIAALENSDKGKAENRRALAYWQKILGHSPRTVFPWGRGVESSEPEIRVVLKSRAVVVALSELASRYGARMPSVALAAISSVMAAASDDTRVMYQVVCSNRGSALIRSSVGCIAQGGLFFVDTNTRTFSELIIRTGRAELMAYGSARYDSIARNAVVKEVGLQRGVQFDLHTIVSDGLLKDLRSVESQQQDLLTIDEALSDTQIESSTSDFVASERFLLHIGYQDGVAHLTVKADPGTFTEHLVRAILQGIESVLVGACSEDRSPDKLARDAGMHPPKKGAEWVHTDMGWVNLSSVTELVEHTGLAKVISVRHHNEAGVVVHLDSEHTRINEETLRGQVISLLTSYPSAVAPAHYIFGPQN